MIPHFSQPARWLPANVLVALLLFIASSFAGILFGQDLNWDALNYHYYLPHLWLEGRFEQDLFAAGKQSYLNPVLYVPFYWLVELGASPWLVVVVLSLIQSATFFATYLLVSHLLRNKFSALFTALIFIVCLLSPLCFQLLGTTFTDLTIAGFQLLSLLLMLKAARSGSLYILFAAGVLMAAAAGFKYIYAVYCLALGIAVIAMLLMTGRSVLRGALACAAGGLSGFILVDGWWALILIDEFGNPVFPYFSGIFNSEYYYNFSYPIERFRKAGILEMLSFPFLVALPKSYYFSELISPDVRIAASVLLVVAAIIMVLIRRSPLRRVGLEAVLLSVFWVSAFSIWAWISGNGRYALVLWLTAPVISVLLAGRFLRESQLKVYWSIVLVVQVTVLVLAGNPRWSLIEWSDEWYPYEVPEELAAEPGLFLSAEKISYSFLAGKMHPESSFATAMGQVPFPVLVQPMNRLSSMAQRADGNIWGISVYSGENASGLFAAVQSKEGIFSRLGFMPIDDCHKVTANFETTGVDAPSLAVCRLVRSDDGGSRAQEQETRFAELFSRVATVCPALFRPLGMVPVKSGTTWQVDYPGTENILAYNNGSFIVRARRGMRWYKLADLDAITRMTDCPLASEQLY